jgi:hypothetical protein
MHFLPGPPVRQTIDSGAMRRKMGAREHKKGSYQVRARWRLAGSRRPW